jgi:hypothetical protein
MAAPNYITYSGKYQLTNEKKNQVGNSRTTLKSILCFAAPFISRGGTAQYLGA